MADKRIVRLAELPSAEAIHFLDTAFFTNRGATLPSPDEVRKRGLVANGNDARGPRPDPAVFQEQGLLVKYGLDVTIAEAQCLWFFNRHMKDRVPTPELYGWRCDGGETFIYMELVQGDTLQERWSSLSAEERSSISQQLRHCIEAWRELRQETQPYFVGHIGRQGLGDIIFSDAGNPNPGPFKDITAFHDFFANYSCRWDPEPNPRRDFPELAGLTDDRPVVFTHADLHRSNILISPLGVNSGPRVVAILDWHQSGWYPIDWEWLKAQWTCDAPNYGPRDTSWLTEVLPPADDDYFYAWEYINSCL